MTAPLLHVQGLAKRFGGLVVTDQVDLQVHPGRIHALIGPNGAGKTTLVAQLAGQLPSDAGRVLFDGHDITGLVAHQRARRGLLRSFQITRLFKSLSVLGQRGVRRRRRRRGQLLGLGRAPRRGPGPRGGRWRCCSVWASRRGLVSRSSSCRTASSVRWRWA